MLLDGLRKPNETFVIAHRRDVAGNDRGRVFHEIGLDVWHRITSAESGTVKDRQGISHFSDQFRAQVREPDRPAASRTRDFCSVKKPNNPLLSAGFRTAATGRQTGRFRPLQAWEALLYAAGSANPYVSPYSSVAQR